MSIARNAFSAVIFSSIEVPIPIPHTTTILIGVSFRLFGDFGYRGLRLPHPKLLLLRAGFEPREAEPLPRGRSTRAPAPTWPAGGRRDRARAGRERSIRGPWQLNQSRSRGAGSRDSDRA